MNKVKVALVGANGMLATMVRAGAPTGYDLALFDLPELDITLADQVAAVLVPLRPDIVINCAAFTQVDACENQVDTAFKVNGTGPANLAAVVKKIDAVLLHISTDFVFSGESSTPYTEDSSSAPISVYGRSKLQGEQAIISSGLEKYYIVRTSWLYGPNGANFVETIIRLANEREELGVVADQIGTPTYTADLATVLWQLLAPDKKIPFGIYHYSNGGKCSWYEFTSEIVHQLRRLKVPLTLERLKSLTTAQYPLPAPRPAYSVLSKEKIIAATGIDIPMWQDSLSIYLTKRNTIKKELN